MDKENTKNQKTTHSEPIHAPHTTEAFGLSEKELKSKDEVQRQLTLSFDWVVAHRIFVLFFLGILFVSGLGYVVYNKTKMDMELKIQDQYFVIEKKYLDQKAQFVEAEKEHKADLEKAKAPQEKNKDKDKDKNKVQEAKTPKVLASGDLEKDYGGVVKDFNDLLTAQPKSLAGKMASLMLADIYSEHNKLAETSETLNKSFVKNPHELIDFLIAIKKVNALLSLNEFTEAKKILMTLVNQKKYPFLSSQFKLQLGLAYAGSKQWDKAETQFQEIVAKGAEAETLSPEEMSKRNRFSSDVSAFEQAQKYLILLRLKKDSEKAGS
ncbi:MAG: hypothetical protein J0M15_12485 [Deltaproteobacteria bacterium]|nr:hypothetical protein [Deltaproteobacteria bacterium]